MKPKSSGLAPDIFIKQIENGNIPTVVCIVGEEPYYRDLVRRKLLDTIFTDTPPDSRDITVFEEKTDMKKLDTLINTYPFFSGRTVILITDKELLTPKAEAEGKKAKSGGKGKAKEKAKETGLSKQDQFQTMLGDVPDFCTVILQAEKMDGRQKFTKFLQKETVFVDCSPVDSVPRWIPGICRHGWRGRRNSEADAWTGARCSASRNTWQPWTIRRYSCWLRKWKRLPCMQETGKTGRRRMWICCFPRCRKSACLP